MGIGISYRHHAVEGSYDAIVVGSGIGGLATAALLAKHAEMRVLVLERHYTAGGFTHTFRRRGFEWDVGVHYIGQLGNPNTLIRRIFDDITEAKLEWADMGDVYDRVIIGDDTYDFVKGPTQFRDRICSYFPEQTEAIDRYLEAVKATAGSARRYFAEKAMPGAVSALAGGVIRRSGVRNARRTTREVLDEVGASPRLAGVLTAQWGDYGLPPSQSSFFIHALVAGHYLWGGSYPIGGSGRIAETIVPVIESRNGAVYTSAEVETILVEKGRATGVRLTDGNELFAPLVISDAGAHLTFTDLVPEASEFASLTAAGGLQELSMSHVCLYVGLNRTAEELGLTKPNLWVYPSDDHDGNLARYAADPTAPLPVAYISFPSAKDPDFGRRYPGKATLEVIGFAPFAWFAPWQGERWSKRGTEYEALKDGLVARLLEQLHQHVPQVDGAIEHMELSSPLSTIHFTGHAEGAVYGLAATPQRFAEQKLRPRTAIKGLYLTGVDVATPGVAGGLMGAMLTASTIVGRDLGNDIARGAEVAREGAQPAAEPGSRAKDHQSDTV